MSCFIVAIGGEDSEGACAKPIAAVRMNPRIQTSFRGVVLMPTSSVPYSLPRSAACQMISQFGRKLAVDRAGYRTAIVTVFEAAPPTDSTTGTAFPAGAFSGTCALT